METLVENHTRKRKIECKPELVIASLQRFYATHPEIDKVLTYLIGDAPLSLRIIDWFVTKYSRKTFVRYPLNGQEFLVYLSYKGQLKAYSKQYFDEIKQIIFDNLTDKIQKTEPVYDSIKDNKITISGLYDEAEEKINNLNNLFNLKKND
mgnify:CR=1 FL=1